MLPCPFFIVTVTASMALASPATPKFCSKTNVLPNGVDVGL